MSIPDESGADEGSRAGGLTLSQALQRAFIEAGNPSLRSVADAGTKVSRQRLSDWRAGRHVPATFADLEPVLAYLYIAAEAARETAPPTADQPTPDNYVTTWPPTRWRQIWEHAATAATPGQAPTTATANQSAAFAADQIDRRPMARAIIALLVLLVAALALAAYIISSLTLRV